ncbi:MAG TPA: hypothetical protein VFO79_13510 [Xanthomonadales bacterium]|nr:hypothetical protein [Xanthomonadales bacterium]
MLAAVALLALVALALTRLPPAVQVLLALGVAANAWIADRALRRGAAVRLALQPDGGWLARDASGDAVLALRDHAIVGPLVALRFEGPGRPPDKVLLLPGMVAPDTLRALRVWLRHGYALR